MSLSHSMGRRGPQPEAAGLARAGDTVSATISEDRSAGATAAEESCFGMLAAGHDAGSSTINPALLAANSMRSPTMTVGVPQTAGLTPAQRVAQQLAREQQHLTPWGARATATADSQPMHALQDYQMQLLLLEQQNKKRLMMARQEQDSIAPSSPPPPPPPPPPPSAPGPNLPQLIAMAKQNKSRDTSARQEPSPATPNTDRPKRDDHPMAIMKDDLTRLEEFNQKRLMIARHEQTLEALRAQEPGPLENQERRAQAYQQRMRVFEEQQRLQSELLAEARRIIDEDKASRGEISMAWKPSPIPDLSSLSPRSRQAILSRQPPATAPMSCDQANMPRGVMARQPPPRPRSPASPPIWKIQRAQAILEVRAGVSPPLNPSATPQLHGTIAAQVAAQRNAMLRADQIALEQSAERQRWLQENNSRLTVKMAQMWEQHRRMAPLGPGQSDTGPPAILMAQQDKSLFPDGQLESQGVSSAEENQTSGNIPDFLMPQPGLPLFPSEQQAQASAQAQPDSPGNGRKRSLDETRSNNRLTEPHSSTNNEQGTEYNRDHSLREKRSRIVPVNSEDVTVAEDLFFPTIPEDNDWECIALSPGAGSLGITFDNPTTGFEASQTSTGQEAEVPTGAISPVSAGTLPEIEDALMVDVDDAGPQTGLDKGKAKEVSSASPTSDGAHRQYFRTLHRVHCSKTTCRGKIYEDVPQVVDTSAAGPGHMAGATVISDLQAYVARQPLVSLVVFKDYECPQHAARNWTQPNESYSNEIRVVSDELKRTLVQISTCVPDQTSQSRRQPNNYNRPPPPEGVYSPRFLYHHRDALRAIVGKDRSRADIATLHWYLEHESPDANKLQACDRMFSRGKVSAETLPWLFCPNTIVIATKEGPDSNIPAAYVLEDWPVEIDGGLQLNGWSWGYDGHKLQHRQSCLTVKIAMDETVDITSLSVYPAKFMTGEMREKLVKRGKQFWGYRYKHHVSYQGWDYQKERKYSEGSRCMIDYQTYKKFHSTANAFSFSQAAKALYDHWPDSISNTEELSDDNLMLLPPDIHGFFLKDKRWVLLCLDQIAPVTWNKLAFDRLVLSQKTKTLVRAMVLPRAHKDAEAEPEVRGDLIAGKGNGLIMLLHGPPGTGKTLTAESVAELAEMPLYSVTCGDIGTSPEAVERYLNTVLHLGKTWNCVLLLDEADVFLEQRSMADLDRNSLVSVFLRTLEYYSGILILTSNRVSIFDEAFKSRIQVALSYPRLDKASRKRVWQNFITMLHEDDGHGPNKSGGRFLVDYTGIVSRLDDLASRELNGRQIRNAMVTARQLAGYLGETLKWEHLETAITTASDFTTPQAAEE